MNVSKFLILESWKKWSWIVVHAVLIIGLSFVILFPIIQKLSTAIKHQCDLFSPIVVWIAQTRTLYYFKEVFRIMDYWETLLNTVLLSSMTTILKVVSSALSG